MQAWFVEDDTDTSVIHAAEHTRQVMPLIEAASSLPPPVRSAMTSLALALSDVLAQLNQHTDVRYNTIKVKCRV